MKDKKKKRERERERENATLKRVISQEKIDIKRKITFNKNLDGSCNNLITCLVVRLVTTTVRLGCFLSGKQEANNTCFRKKKNVYRLLDMKTRG